MMANEEQDKKQKMIAVCSAKGGVGRTLISVNLAIALTKKNLSVTLLDGNFQFGDVSLAMDLQPSFTIKDVIEELSRLDTSTIGNYLTSHTSGVKVLPSPEKPEFAELITNEAALKVVDLLRPQSDYLIIDTCIGIGDQTVDLIDRADQIVIVTNLEMTALKSTRLMLETLDKLGLSKKVVLVVNRYDMDSLIKAEDVPDMIGHQQVIYLPNNFKTASQSLNLGVPLVVGQSKSNIAKALFKMAEHLISDQDVSVTTKKKGLFAKKERGV